jgi:hypothetical protein
MRAITARQREQLRADLRGDLQHLEHCLALARQSLSGPDPEAALGYVAGLAASCDNVLGEHARLARAGAVPIAQLRRPDLRRRAA